MTDVSGKTAEYLCKPSKNLYGVQAQAEPVSGRVFLLKFQSDLSNFREFGIIKIFFL
jgi:hypothetical protein